MKFITLATATAIVACSAGFAAAQQTITVNIGSSHPEQNIWVYAMKNTFEPEVNRILEAAGEYKINWVESYGGTLYKFKDTRAAVRDGIVDVGMVGTVWEGSAMPLLVMKLIFSATMQNNFKLSKDRNRMAPFN